MTTSDPLRFFQCTWQIERRIEDALSGQAAHLIGQVHLSPDNGGLAYHELGQLRIEGQRALTAERRYFWRAEGSLIRVLFDDGRDFHSFDPGVARSEAHHDCAPDNYLVRYDFSKTPIWSTRWQVTGPRKSYVMTTVYRQGD